MLGHAAQHARELADRAVHAAQRQKGSAAPGTELVRRDVVVEIVHVHGRDPGVEIARDRQREEAAHPHRVADLDRRPAPAAAYLGRMRDQAREGSPQLDDGAQQVLQADPDQDHERRERGEHPLARGLRQAGEAEQVVDGAAGEHTAISAAALDDAAPAGRLLGLDQRGVSSPREVDVGLPLPVEVVEARDVGAYAVHRRHLESRGRGRQADRHRFQAVAVTPEQSVEEGHAPGRQCPLQDDARQAVDLHDQQPPVRVLGRAAPAQSADETIERALEGQSEDVGRHRHARSSSGCNTPGALRPVAASAAPHGQRSWICSGITCLTSSISPSVTRGQKP